MAKLFRQNKLANTVIKRNFERMDMLSVWIASPVIIGLLVFHDTAQLLASIFVNEGLAIYEGAVLSAQVSLMAHSKSRGRHCLKVIQHAI